MRSLIPRAALAALLLALGLGACAAAPGGSPPMDAAAAARLALAQQGRFAGIGPRDDNLIGQASWYQVTDVEDGWQVLIRIGWGDCEAGCINEHRWTYAVTRTGSVKLVGEEGDALPDATGVRGTVTSGPTCPVETIPPDPACASRPVVGAVLVFSDAGGAEVARATSADDGTFSVELAPGAYRVTPQPVEGMMGTPAVMDVVVEAGQPPTELQVSYDTGIRG
ncbi:MAG: carboxypeptidase regulatory-like domain-containing protein [Chloroflexi bacterium]|nr:carboxypeptidase regulatory-like domain-containing protein [Chloroflexota bacterium]